MEVNFNNDEELFDYYDDMSNYYAGKESRYKYPALFEIDYETALELTDYSGYMTSAGSKEYYDSNIGGLGGWQSGSSSEYDLPDREEVADGFKKYMIAKFAKMNNIDPSEIEDVGDLGQAFLDLQDEEYGIPDYEDLYAEAEERSNNYEPDYDED